MIYNQARNQIELEKSNLEVEKNDKINAFFKNIHSKTFLIV